MPQQKQPPDTESMTWIDNVKRNRFMSHFVKSKEGERVPSGNRIDFIPFSSVEAKRAWGINANLSAKNFRGWDKQRVVLPSDNQDVAGKQLSRRNVYYHNAAMARYSQFMVTPSDAQRMNNPQQASFNRQRQLVGPNSTHQFYAFMHALSAAFGQVS